MNKRLIRLTEGDLHRIVKESVNRVIKEEQGSSASNYINSLEQALIKAYQMTPQDFEIPQEAIEAAKENDGIDLYEEFQKIQSCLYTALKSFRPIKYYMNMPFKNFGNEIDI
jgi:hypothetical protein